jgi:hypothetical protein
MLKGSLVSIDEITDRDVLYALMIRHYAQVDRVSFEADLEEKDGAITLRDDLGMIRGFSTYQFMHLHYLGREITVLFSGDTVIDRAFWGDSALFRTFGKLLYRTLNSTDELYWFLISKGIRTYQILPLFFNRFYPSVAEETPIKIASLIHHLAELKYPGSFEVRSGVIKADTYRLRENMADVPPNKNANPHVRFFLEKNPGWLNGDELACLSELSIGNMKRSALRMIQDWDH